ncbi:MAG: hypothetical protein FJW96_03305 [Actinobacteria bacterium]|nr:hypothetical protein [Actinomycetota bacterium]
MTAITGTSATLNGTVNPNGTATTWQFEYGTTTGYGSKEPATATNAGSGTANQAVSASLKNLEPGTTYHYRLIASNADGNTVGLDGVFSTPAASAVTTGGVSNLTTTSATVGCSVDPNGVATSWFVEYGTSTSYGTQTSPQNAGSGTTAVNVSANLTGLQPARTYNYRCVATNANGTVRGANATFSTIDAPGATTGATSALGSTTATVTGKVEPKGRSTSYFFEYGTTTSYGSRTSTSSAGNSTGSVNVSKSLSGLASGTTYHYRLVATSDGGTTRGADATLTTLGPPTVNTGGVSSVTATSAVLLATVNPNGRSTSWWFEYGTSTAYGQRTSTRSLGSSTRNESVSIQISGLQPGTTFHYRVVAQSGAGTSRGGNGSFATAGPPSVATGTLPVASLGPGGAKVTGVVNPRGLVTTAWFEYGPSPAYGQRTAQVSVGSGTADVPFEAEIRGVKPGSRTFFRLVAVSEAGSAIGVGKSFGTPVASVLGRRCTIAGTQGHDVLVGTPGPDVICGLAGNDVIRGLGGDDVLAGGPGNDVLNGGDGADIIDGGTGDDIIKGEAGGDRLLGKAGNDQILGGTGGDTIEGGPGDDSAVVDELDKLASIERRR